MDDVFFLPLHPLAIHHLQENLHNMNKVNSTVVAARSRAPILQEQVEPHEKVFYRFFPTPKEVSNLAYSMQKSGQVKDDDWANIHSQLDSWKESDVVIYFQAYDPENEDPEKPPFILVMQNDWMQELAIQITPNSAWAIDSTFKTNQYGLPLYAAMCPNNRGYGMPIFLMLCSKDIQAGHEATALRFTLRAVLDRMGPVRPNAIVIDKSIIELNAFTTVINEDPWCWANNITGGEQIKCKLLLCWFYVKKAWMEHLVPHVTADKRTQLYRDICGLLECLTEDQFNSKYVEFKITWASKFFFKQCCDWMGGELQVAWYVATIQSSLRAWICEYNKFCGKIMAFH